MTENLNLLEVDKLDAVPGVHGDIYTCINCGANSFESPRAIEHYSSCKPGESKRWEEYYNQPDKESDEPDS